LVLKTEDGQFDGLDLKTRRGQISGFDLKTINGGFDRWASKLEMASRRMHCTIAKLASRQSEVVKAGPFNVATKRWTYLPLKVV
jgi:hypothetical protein